MACQVCNAGEGGEGGGGFRTPRVGVGERGDFSATKAFIAIATPAKSVDFLHSSGMHAWSHTCSAESMPLHLITPGENSPIGERRGRVGRGGVRATSASSSSE